jgi:ribosomal protein S18 acetylase RimI-like enzyme
MSISVRSFIPQDKDFILSLVSRFSEFELPEWQHTDEIDNTNRLALLKAMEQPEPESAIFVAEDETAGPVGFIHLQTRIDYFNGEKQGYISDIAVDSSYESRSVGGMLLGKAESWNREQGYTILTLFVFAGNTHAQQIYKRSGFGQDIIRYAKVIDQKA